MVVLKAVRLDCWTVESWGNNLAVSLVALWVANSDQMRDNQKVDSKVVNLVEKKV